MSLYSLYFSSALASHRFKMIPTRGANIMPLFTFSRDWPVRLRDLQIILKVYMQTSIVVMQSFKYSSIFNYVQNKLNLLQLIKTYKSKNSASAAEVTWFSTKSTNSVNLLRFVSDPNRNAWGISRVKNSKTLARLHERSNMTLHFLWWESSTCKSVIRQLKWWYYTIWSAN